MKEKERVKMAVLIIAGIFIVLSSVGAPDKRRSGARQRYLDATDVVLKNCVTDPQLKLPSLENTIPALCLISSKSGKLENYGPVSIPKPVLNEEGQVNIYNKD